MTGEEELAEIRRSFAKLVSGWTVEEMARKRNALKRKKTQDDIDDQLASALDGELLKREEGQR